MNILIIGGAGYIGGHVVKKFCDEGCTVTVFDNLSSGFKENVDQRAELVISDIMHIDDLEKVFSKKPDVVIHLAAHKDAGESMHKPEKYSRNNISGTINILAKMVEHNVKRIIFSSSAAVYGSPQYLPMDEEHPLNPENYYGFTKLEIERLLEWYSKLKEIQYAALRYFNAAGYGTIRGKEKNPGNLIPIVMEVAAGTRKDVKVYGNDYDTPDGTGIRDYIHVLDLADAHYRALQYLEKHHKNLIVNLSTEKGHSVLEIIKKTEEITGKKVLYEITPRRPGDPATIYASSKLAYELLGWKAEHSTVDEIIKTTWDVYKN
ncbi:MAG: UDP-glucose 4-epimerase GalE [Candidatus Woesearchaeota archaeon]